MTIANMHAVRELVLYTDNTRIIYERHTLPVIENLRKKAKRGTYDPEKAAKAWGYVAEAAAKAYAREYDRPENWCRLFNASTRRAAAAELEETNREQVFEGVLA